MFRSAILVLLLLVIASHSNADLPVCLPCECTLDSTTSLMMVPDSEGHPICEFTVQAINMYTCEPVAHAIIEILVGGQVTENTGLCPDGEDLIKTADGLGHASFRIAGGGCYRSPGAIVIRVNGIECRAYDRVVSPDYAGWDNVGEPNRWNHRVNPVDLAAFIQAFQGGTGPASCHDYDNDGFTDPKDLSLFCQAYGGGTTHCDP